MVANAMADTCKLRTGRVAAMAPHRGGPGMNRGRGRAAAGGVAGLFAATLRRREVNPMQSFSFLRHRPARSVPKPRARLSGLLPALALLLGALGLFTAAPAQAQTVTLTG